MMANRPSQGCLACEGRGWVPSDDLGTIKHCPVCNGFGRITIKLARILRLVSDPPWEETDSPQAACAVRGGAMRRRA